METTLEFVGTATTLLRLGPFTLLTDPNFLHRGQRAYLGKGLWSRRRTEPSLQPAQLPELDAVVLSHLHGDHFDRVGRRELDDALPILTTPTAAHRLRRWGFGSAAGLSTWDGADLTAGAEILRITSVPGQHAPSAVRHLMPEVMGSVLELRDASGSVHRTYVTGDTLCRPWLREVPERLGPIDALVVHLGGTRILGLTLTMDAEAGADLLQLVRPGLATPVHLDDYPVFRSGLSDFLRACRQRGIDGAVRTVEPGGTISLQPR